MAGIGLQTRTGWGHEYAEYQTRVQAWATCTLNIAFPGDIEGADKSADRRLLPSPYKDDVGYL